MRHRVVSIGVMVAVVAAGMAGLWALRGPHGPARVGQPQLRAKQCVLRVSSAPVGARVGVDGVGYEDSAKATFVPPSRLTPCTVTIDVSRAQLPSVPWLLIQKEGYEVFSRPFLCEAGRRHEVNAQLVRSPRSRYLDAAHLEQVGLQQPNATGLEVDLDCDGSAEIVVTGKEAYRVSGKPFPEVRVYRRTGQSYSLALHEEVGGLLPDWKTAVDLDCNGRPEVLQAWSTGGSTAWAAYDILFAGEQGVQKVGIGGYQVGLAQLDEGGPCEIMIGELVGMSRSRADATYHHLIYHWTGHELADVSHRFPEYYTGIEIPCYEALLGTIAAPEAGHQAYRAELEEALSLARKAARAGPPPKEGRAYAPAHGAKHTDPLSPEAHEVMI